MRESQSEDGLEEGWADEERELDVGVLEYLGRVESEEVGAGAEEADAGASDSRQGIPEQAEEGKGSTLRNALPTRKH